MRCKDMLSYTDTFKKKNKKKLQTNILLVHGLLSGKRVP